MDTKALMSGFKKAGLKLEIVDKPFARRRGVDDIFGMDIDRRFKGTRRTEVFQIFPGHESNRVLVQGIDKNLGQLVLMVHEKRRPFEVEISKKRVLERPENTVQETSKNWVVRQFTPENKRHFLMGLDERQLFIAQLPRSVSTVREAHACLKAPTVWTAEGKHQGRTFRQGEWFFLNTTSQEKAEIEKAIKKGLVLRKESIGKHAGRDGGNAHIAEELVILPGPKLKHGFRVRQRDEVYVRGAIRHVDHKTLKIRQWRRVIANTESNSGRMEGVEWFD